MKRRNFLKTAGTVIGASAGTVMGTNSSTLLSSEDHEKTVPLKIARGGGHA